MAEQAGLDSLFDIERAELLDGIPHGFFGSRGGKQQFGYGGPGDERVVGRLRATAADVIRKGAPLQAPHQVHSPEVVTLGKTWPDLPEGRPVADGVVTDRRDVVLAIVTADCAPILFADREAGIVGAAHAGWRGAVCEERGGVLENTISSMVAIGSKRENIAAVVGPTIAQASYEVDEAFREHFTEAEEHFFVTAPEREGRARWHFDLPGYIMQRLQQAGLKKIANLDQDTFAQPERYHSFRRASQKGDPNYGRQVSAIAVP